MIKKTKPLARWTIGGCSNLGIEVLKESIFKFSEAYPEFDKVLCYNNLTSHNLEEIKKIKIRKHKQTNEECSFVMGKQNFMGDNSGCGWKLSPTRLNKNGHELWIDNDMVIVERIEIIDKWKRSNFSIISKGIHRVYDVFEKEIKGSLCAGLFGLPPRVDIHNFIKENYEIHKKPLGGFYEQGLVAKFVTNMNYKVIEISNAEKKYSPNKSGYHFVGVNRTENHKSWNEYKK